MLLLFASAVASAGTFEVGLLGAEPTTLDLTAPLPRQVAVPGGDGQKVSVSRTMVESGDLIVVELLDKRGRPVSRNGVVHIAGKDATAFFPETGLCLRIDDDGQPGVPWECGSSQMP